MKLSEKITSQCVWVAGAMSLGISFFFLYLLVSHVISTGWESLDWKFLTSPPSRFVDKAGVWPALVGTFYIVLIAGMVSVPLGILTAIYLEEFRPKRRIWKRIRALVRLNVANLSGVPSIVYGMLGLAFFVRSLELGRSLLAGGLTMGLLVLPVIVMATLEALRAVPLAIREAAYGVGASRAQVTFLQVLPQAFPGILTGIILACSRAAGETAPLILVGAAVFILYTPEHLLDDFTALPIQIFSWSALPGDSFKGIAAGGILVLLLLTLGLNSIAIYLRTKFSKKNYG